MSNPDVRIWENCVAHVRKTYPNLSRQWFDDLEPVGMVAGVLYVHVTQPIHLRYLQRECTPIFQEAAQTVTGRLLSIRFVGEAPSAVVEPKANQRDGVNNNGSWNESVKSVSHESGIQHASPSSGRDAQSAHALQQTSVASHDAASNGHSPATWSSAFDDMVINPDFTFDHFIHGPNNQLAFSAARAVAENPGRAYNPFFVHGGVGLGKTHLLQAICHEILGANPGAQIYYVSCEGFVSQFLDAVQRGRMADFKHRFRHVDVLVMDDIHFLGGHEQTQEEFFHTFNTLYQAGKQIVLSSDAAPTEIPDIEERLTSRFKAGLVARMDRPTYETRLYILRAKAQLRDVIVPDDVLSFLAGRVDNNVRELEGALTQVQGYALADDVPITLELAQRALGEQQTNNRSRLSIHEIIEAVCHHFDVRMNDLLSKRRTQSIAFPRQVGMYLSRQLTSHSLQEIGRLFGGRDHTTVMHAIEKIQNRRSDDEVLERDLQTLEQLLTSHAAPAG